MTPREKFEKVVQDGLQKIEDIYQPLLTDINLKITDAELNNQDPKDYYDESKKARINLIAIKEIYLNSMNETVSRFNEKMEIERQKIIDAEIAAEQTQPAEAPENEWYQILFLIIKQVLEEGVQIKIGDVEWDSSKPLGGEGSVFDEVRTATMRSVGIDPDSDLGKILKDPLNAPKDILDNVNDETKEFLTNARVAADKATEELTEATKKVLEQTKEFAEKAAKDAAKVAEKAAKDAARAAEKAAQDATKAAEKAAKDAARAAEKAAKDAARAAEKAAKDAARAAEKAARDAGRALSKATGIKL